MSMNGFNSQYFNRNLLNSLKDTLRGMVTEAESPQKRAMLDRASGIRDARLAKIDARREFLKTPEGQAELKQQRDAENDRQRAANSPEGRQERVNRTRELAKSAEDMKTANAAEKAVIDNDPIIQKQRREADARTAARGNADRGGTDQRGAASGEFTMRGGQVVRSSDEHYDNVQNANATGEWIDPNSPGGRVIGQERRAATAAAEAAKSAKIQQDNIDVRAWAANNAKEARERLPREQEKLTSMEASAEHAEAMQGRGHSPIATPPKGPAVAAPTAPTTKPQAPAASPAAATSPPRPKAAWETYMDSQKAPPAPTAPAAKPQAPVSIPAAEQRLNDNAVDIYTTARMKQLQVDNAKERKTENDRTFNAAQDRVAAKPQTVGVVPGTPSLASMNRAAAVATVGMPTSPAAPTPPRESVNGRTYDALTDLQLQNIVRNTKTTKFGGEVLDDSKQQQTFIQARDELARRAKK